ncbi:hypothetical protein BH11PLA2_BH11PLA2_46150 [soil metagenome]
MGATASLTDPLLVGRAQDYRRHIAGRMIPLDAEDIVKRLPKGDYRASLKVDGEFNILVFANGEALLVNPGGTVRVGLPLLKEAAELLGKAKLKSAILAGELHYNRPDGKRGRVHDVSRVARSPESEAELDRLGFASFDIIEIDGVKITDSYVAELARIGELFKGSKRCTPVETVAVTEAAEIQKQYAKWIETGAEGVVVRSDAIGAFKIKPRHTIDAVVIGFTEGTDDRTGMIHDLLMALMRPDGCLQVLGHVGGGFSNDDRRAYLSDLKDRIVPSDYTEVNDQVAYHMVKPEWVVEISVLDLIPQSTRGEPVKTMALQWTGTKYEIVRRLPLVNLISPQFVRRREDKAVNGHDLRLSQVTDLVEVTLADRDARKLNRPASTILKREVCTKVLKGATTVRKLVMWQTNKDADGDEFPAYVIHATDYSPNRKTPLERDIRISSSRDQIEALWTALAEESFGKGWTPAGAGVAEKPAPKKATKKKADESATDETSETLAAPKKRASKKKAE